MLDLSRKIKMNKKITAEEIKRHLYNYWARERACICCDELFHSDDRFRADFVVLQGKSIIEIEIKISKSDLINGEKKKELKWSKNSLHSKYGLCVPKYLADEAKKWIDEQNPKYGLIVLCEERPVWNRYDHNLWIRRDFRKLNDKKATEDDIRNICLRNSRKIASLLTKENKNVDAVL